MEGVEGVAAIQHFKKVSQKLGSTVTRLYLEIKLARQLASDGTLLALG